MLPTVVDAWFRQLIKENKKSRENLQVERDDFLQTLLNTTEKSGMSFRWQPEASLFIINRLCNIDGISVESQTNCFEYCF